MKEADKTVAQMVEADFLHVIACVLDPSQVTVVLDEGQRQMVLMALAHLSVERPGWDAALNEIALKMDREIDSQGFLYTKFKDIRRRLIVPEEVVHKAQLFGNALLTDVMKGKHGDPITPPD